MATTKKHPRDLSDADVDALVAAFDDAVDQGRVRPADGAVFRELRAAAAGRRAAEERLEASVIAAKAAGLIVARCWRPESHRSTVQTTTQ